MANNPTETIREALQFAALCLTLNPVQAEREKAAEKCRAALTALDALPVSVAENAAKAGKAGRAVKSEAQAAAARANGAKGGRPRTKPRPT